MAPDSDNPTAIEAYRAREYLASKLSPQVDLTVRGVGVHWHIEARRAQRKAEVHVCYQGRGGFEFAHQFYEADERIADGRTRDLSNVSTALRVWVGESATLAELCNAVEFVQGRLRRLRVLAAEIDRVLRETDSKSHSRLLHNELGDTAHRLWFYGEDRSCEIDFPEDSQPSLTLHWKNTPMAEGSSDSPAVIAAVLTDWLERESETLALAERFPFVEPAEWAPYYEAGRFLEWEWRAACQAASNPKATLGMFHSGLIPLLAAREAPRAFFTFTSHAILCFSRTSDYPFDTSGLPQVEPVGWPLSEGWSPRYAISLENQPIFEGSPEDVADKLGELLEPYVGSSSYGDSYSASCERSLQELDRQLESLGCDIVVERIQVGKSVFYVAEAGNCCALLRWPQGDLAVASVEIYENTPGPFADWKHEGVDLKPTRKLKGLDALATAKTIAALA